MDSSTRKAPVAHVESTEPTAMPAPKSKTKVTLEGTQGTLLATLWARYTDAGYSPPVFGDRWAAYVVDQIEWDWSRFRFTKFFCYLMSLRGNQMDAWTASFLEKHKETGATIVRKFWTPLVWKGKPEGGVGESQQQRAGHGNANQKEVYI